MESLFESVYARDKKIAHDLYRYIYYTRPAAILSHILYFAAFFASLMLLIFWDEDDTRILYYVLIVIPVAYELLKLVQYLQAVSLMCKRDREMNKDQPIYVATTFYDVTFQVAAGENKNEMTYERIDQAIRTKNLIYLRTRTNLLFLIPNDSFVKGTSALFLSFLKSKGIKIK